LIFPGRIKNIVQAPVRMLLLNFEMSEAFHFPRMMLARKVSDNVAVFALSPSACTFFNHVREEVI
jgi:hypothetical protein